MSYYVYELFDPRDGATFYVGKGKGDRIDAHERDARAGQSRKCERIREIQSLDLAIGKRRVQHFKDEQEAYNFEADLIDQYGLENLTNIVPGGGGAAGPSIGGDRQKIRLFAKYVNITRNGRAVMFLRGERFDFVSILEEYKKRTAVIIERRGLDWVNATAQPFGVEYCYAQAA